MIRIGVDIGQKRDPTAIAVAEIQRRHFIPNRDETHFLIRYLTRLPLGSSYPEIARRVAEIANLAHQHHRDTTTVYLDATGVGQPVVDLVAEQWSGGRLVPVYFTHGDRRHDQGDKISFGKAFLVARLQSLLQTDRIHLPESNEAQALAQELRDYEIRVDENANDRYGAFRVGTHDDLVTALGLAVQDDAKATAGIIPGF